MKITNLRSLLRTALLCCTLAGGNWALAQYCLPSYNTPCTSDDYIDMVSFAGINTTGTGCGTPGLNNYTYNSSLTANVATGNTYPITCAPGPTWGQYFIALIDFNHDNDFSDADEFFDIGYSFGGGTVTNSITIPCNAMTGLTRLRIMCRYANTPLVPADICATGLSFGEVEDFNINITATAGADGMVSRFVSPNTGCGLGAAEPVAVKVKNIGGSVINGFTVCYTINGGAPVCETVSTVIPACDSVTHTFASTANLSAFATYDFDATLTVSGDINPANNNLNNHMVTNIPVISTLPYNQDFNASNGGWTATGVSSTWAWGAPTGTFINAAASAPNAWVTNLSGLYNADEFSYLTSPCFNFGSLTANPYVAFGHIFDIENFGDLGYVEVTTNAGATWTKLGTAATGNNWYNNIFGDNWDGQSGNAGQWRLADHVLTGAAGSTGFRLRFVLEADGFGALEGMGVDDIRIVDTLRNAGAVTLLSPTNGCQLSASETVTIELTNYGSHTISNIPVCFRVGTGSPVCETVPGPVAPGATVAYTFTATANLGTLGSYDLTAYTNWSADYNRSNDTVRSTVTSYNVVSTFPYREGFENNNGGWASGGTAFNDWAWGTPAKLVINTAGQGTKCWVTAGLGTAEYSDNANSWVESPCFNLSGLSNPWVLAKIRRQSEFSWDGVVLESSTDGGSTWAQVGAFGDPFNWYNDNSIVGLSNFGGSGDGWTDVAGPWEQAKHALNGLGGLSNVRFRFHFASDASVTEDGFAFDDFIIAEPPVVRLGNDTAICASIVLNPGLSGGTFAWTGGATTPTLTVTSPGTYVLSYTDSLGLVGADTIVISASPTPVVDLGGNRNICTGDTICLNAGPGSYPVIHWSNGDSTSQLCVNSAGSYSVIVFDPMGCESRDTVVTTMVPIPTPYIGADTAICAGDTICLSSNCGPGHFFVWNTGATTNQICVSLLSGYWVRCTDANGCEGADSIIISQAALPVAVGSFDTTNCPVVVFGNTSTGTTAFWDFGDGNTSSAISPSHDYTAAGNGSYTVTLVSMNPCGADTTTLQVDINCLVSIGGMLDNQLKLFPNPTEGRFRLQAQLDGTTPAMVEIADLHGRVVYRRDFGQAAGSFDELFDLGSESKGVYFVKFEAGGQVAVRKVVLQ